MEVSFPASAKFDSLASIAVSNIAFRLNYKMKTVARLRDAVDTASETLGTVGTTKLVADWGAGSLAVTIANPKAKLAKEDVQELRDILTELGATGVALKPGSIAFTI